MEQDLDYLASRVDALVARLGEVGEQNARLAQALAQALKENTELKFCLQETRSRVAQLVERLPAEQEGA